jgi:nitric oxide reductase activation protein
MNGNYDGVAIMEVAKRVRNQTKNPALMFVIADGAPAGVDYGGASAARHVKDMVAQCEKLDITVINIAIESSYKPSEMFKHFVTFTDMNALPQQIAQLMKKQVLKHRKVSIG